MKVVTIAVSPATVSLVAGENQQFQLLENGVAVNATWSLTGSNTINSSGLYSATVIGTSVVTGTDANGNTATATVTVTAPPVSVSASCSPASVPQGQTSTCAASVLNTTNTAVTWTASAGTITSAGVLSVPMSVSAGTVITVTATSVADTTKSATAQVTVAQRQIVLTPTGTEQDELLSPETIVYFTNASVVGDATYISGAQFGDILTVTDLFSGSTGTYTVTAADVTNGYVNWNWAYNCSGCYTKTGSYAGVFTSYAPHYIKVQISSANSSITSNTLWVPLTTDQQTMSSDGSYVYFAPGYPFAVQKYAVVDGSLKSTVMGANNLSIALDSSTGNLFTDQSTATGTGSTTYITSIISSSATSNTLSIQTSTSSVLMSLAAMNGSLYATDTAQGMIDKIDPATMAVSYSESAGTGTWSLDTATVDKTPLIASYSVQDKTLRLHNQNLNLISSLALSDITQGLNAKYGLRLTGGWPLRLFKSGYVTLLSVYDQKLYVAKLDLTNTLTLVSSVALTGNAIGIAKDETHQAVIVWYAGTATGKTTLESFDLATLTGTTIASSNSLPIGFEASGVLVSNDGTKLYVGGIDATGNPAFFILANQ